MIDKIVVFYPRWNADFNCVTLYIRVDHVNQYAQHDIKSLILKAKRQGITGDYTLLASVRYNTVYGDSTDYYFIECEL